MDFCWCFVLVICGIAVEVTGNNYLETDSYGRVKRDNRGNNHGRGLATWKRTAVANRLFAHKLYRNVARSHAEGNLMISPFVVSTALSMVLLGAKGRTEDELMDILEYSGLGMKRHGRKYTKDDVPRLYHNLIKQTARNALQGGYMLTVASKLYGEQTETFLPGFVSDTERYYDARLEEVDFAGHPEEARQSINQWVSSRTQGVIPEALPPNSISSATLLTLVSTAYFKGEWATKFNTSETKPGIFHLRDGTEMTTDFMYGRFQLYHTSSRKFKFHTLVLPYKSQNRDFDVQMELYLPHKRHELDLHENSHETGLHAIETMTEGVLHQELRKLKPKRIHLYLPKFRMNFEIDLAENLRTLGLHSLFDAADLSGMNGKFNLNLGNAIHKNFIEVNENGTTAGSSLAMTMNKSNQMFVLRFDRPFVFIIREKSTNTIFFMGRVEIPET